LQIVIEGCCSVGKIGMSEDESAEERAAREKFEAWLQEIEAAAAEIFEVGDLLFRRGEPTDPALLRRYRLYARKGSGGATAWAGACCGASGGEDPR
jgi:hypothetical protein